MTMTGSYGCNGYQGILHKNPTQLLNNTHIVRQWNFGVNQSFVVKKQHF
jgi:hypothetical protein